MQREMYHWIAMIAFLVMISGAAKPGGEAAHTTNVCRQVLVYQQHFVFQAVTLWG